jgi:hypothetical protein
MLPNLDEYAHTVRTKGNDLNEQRSSLEYQALIQERLDLHKSVSVDIIDVIFQFDISLCDNYIVGLRYQRTLRLSHLITARPKMSHALSPTGSDRKRGL